MERQKKKHSISKKMIGMILGLTMFAMILTNITSLASLVNLQKIAENSLKELGSTAALDSERELEKQALRELLSVASEKTSYIELLYGNIESCVNGIASLAEDIYRNPESYPDRTVDLPVPGSSTLAAQLLRSARLTEENEGKYLAELDKIGNVQDLLVQYNRNNNMISSTYVATASGWMIQADYIAYNKYGVGSEEPLPYEADKREWFQLAQHARQGEVVYTGIMQDAHGGGDCIVCAQPIYHEGEIVAVAGIGSYLTVVSQVVSQTTIGGNGYAFLVNEDGQIMISPKKQGETAADTTEGVDIRNSSNIEFAAEVQKMIDGESGTAHIELDGEEKYIAYVPLEELNWTFVTVMDEEEVLGAAKASQNTILKLEDTANKAMAKQFRILYLRFLLWAAPLVILTVLFGMYFSHRLTRPLLKLKEMVRTIGKGNLDYQIDIHTGDEIEELADTFNQMKLELKNYISSLNQVTAEKERIGAELDIAQKIQRDMLPQIFPAFPERRDFDIYADMQPAKEVGGDFYDFFFVDKNHLAIVIADVSGKGVPAALFMVIAKTLLKNHMQSGETPEQVFYHVNNQLCENNEAGMFVTAWLGLYDFNTGIMTCVNAGHNPPVLMGVNGETTFYKQAPGLVLAGFEDFEYHQYELAIPPGTKIFIYTDGVTEANNAKEELYGEARLCECIERHAMENPAELVHKVKEDVYAYMDGVSQFDDITMLCLEIKGEIVRKKTFPVDESLVSMATTYVEDFLKEQGCDKTALSQVAIVMDEICSNELRYAYPEGQGMLELSCEPVDENSVRICFSDTGVPYNPLEREDPDTSLSATERELGGLGIFMVKQLMDRVEYEYLDGKNCLTVYKKIKDM